jgi:hypothetical protein
MVAKKRKGNLGQRQMNFDDEFGDLDADMLFQLDQQSSQSSFGVAASHASCISLFTDPSHSQQVESVFKEKFGFSNLHEFQREAILGSLAGRDTFILQATGRTLSSSWLSSCWDGRMFQVTASQYVSKCHHWSRAA